MTESPNPDLLKMWAHCWTSSATTLLQYWYTMNYPIRKIVTVYNVGKCHWILITFMFGSPGIMTVLDSMCYSNTTNDIKWIEHYFSLLQNLHFFKKPSIGKVEFSTNKNMNQDECDVMILCHQSDYYKANHIPLQEDDYNCGIYSMYYLTCLTCNARFNAKFNPSLF